ncbi:MAG TPA: DNA polymerase IV [Nocardioidaceae bacterium]|nr:DNA polymerase IV [Nocardioidaceae bacterium]
MRNQASVLHLDLDAFFAAVEQRDKPSLRGKPVIVGGLGPRGVVATASYEARKFGVRSAMSMALARTRCPHAAFLGGRFDAYRLSSDAVMGTLRDLSPVVEPLSFDEAYVDLLAARAPVELTAPALAAVAAQLKAAVQEATGGLTSSVGIGSSKLVAKVASELDKPDGCVVVPPGTERDLLRPMQVTVLPGVGPATAERLHHIGIHTVEELEQLSREELVRILGQAQGSSVFLLARAEDDRPVVPVRETKSVSVEDTFDYDLVDQALLEGIVDRQASAVCARLGRAHLSGRTVTLKVRRHDFTTHTRSTTLSGPTDRVSVVGRLARRLLSEVDTSEGVRLLGVGVSGLVDWVQQDLFEYDEVRAEPPAESTPAPSAGSAGAETARRWLAGADVIHETYGAGWVWGAGLGRVTVRFETADSPPGPIHTLAADDPALSPAPPRPLNAARSAPSPPAGPAHTGADQPR